MSNFLNQISKMKVINLSIYKHALRKYAKTPSTWIILIITVITFMGVGGYLPFQLIKNRESDPIEYLATINILIGAIAGFLAVITCIFASFIGARMFKDEIENGSFLVLLSKPNNRSTIIFSKLLAIFTFILIYVTAVLVGFVLMIVIFDKGPANGAISDIGATLLKNEILKVGAIIWGIMILFGVIFSSIAVLLSTKLPTSATIGIGITIGVIIPVTSLIGVFTNTPEYSRITNSSITNLIHLPRRDKVVNEELTSLTRELFAFYNDEYSTIKDNDLLNIAVRTGATNSFKNLWPVDIDFQIESITSLATSVLTENAPDVIRDEISNESSSRTYLDIKESSAALNESLIAQEVSKIYEWAEKVQSTMFSTLLGNDYIWQQFNDGVTLAYYETSGTLNFTAVITELTGIQPINSDGIIVEDGIIDDGGVLTWLVTEDNYTGFDSLIARDYDALNNDSAAFNAFTQVEKTQFVNEAIGLITAGFTSLQYVDIWQDYTEFLNFSTLFQLANRFSEPLSYIFGLGIYNDNVTKLELTLIESYDESLIEYSITGSDVLAYQTMLTLQNNNELVVVESNLHASPKWLLIFYGGLSLFLLSLTFIIVKRQNFK